MIFIRSLHPSQNLHHELFHTCPRFLVSARRKRALPERVLYKDIDPRIQLGGIITAAEAADGIVKFAI